MQDKAWIANIGATGRRPDCEVIKIKTRDGSEIAVSAFRHGVEDLYWRHEGRPQDIVAYM